MRLDIVYEDNSCIVINKPAGLAVQGGKGISVSLDSILAGSRQQRPLLVHRLDRDTSGLILAAKNRAAAAVYSRLLGGGGGGTAAGGHRAVVKRYMAMCKGRPARDEGTISLDLEIRGVKKKSETLYRLIENFEGAYSLLELELGTGRMHQIRRHLALTGSPVLGDGKHGDFSLNHLLRKTMKLNKLLLHAARLIIPEGPDNPRLDLEAPLPEYFGQFINRVREQGSGTRDQGFGS
ncbi:MAG: RluA family pseudouridine synthase [Treponema sp.]|jgi:23S rRNA pseudouridine955/2504/2580 synthase|nr:RluA family pseudouridine synthase [Treponema sp.]